MKTTITIYVDSENVQRARFLQVNISRICNEALNLACIGQEIKKSDGSIRKDDGKPSPWGNFLMQKIQKEDDIQNLRKARIEMYKYRNPLASQEYQNLTKKFCLKYAISWADAVSLSETPRKEVLK